MTPQRAGDPAAESPAVLAAPDRGRVPVGGLAGRVDHDPRRSDRRRTAGAGGHRRPGRCRARPRRSRRSPRRRPTASSSPSSPTSTSSAPEAPGRGEELLESLAGLEDLVVRRRQRRPDRGSGGVRCSRWPPRRTGRSGTSGTATVPTGSSPRGPRRDPCACGRRLERDPIGGGHGRGRGRVAVLRRAADGRDRGRPRHDLPRQHVPGGQQRLQRAVRAARRGRPVGGPGPDLRRPTSAGARTAGWRRSPAASSRSRSSGSGS